MFRQLPDPEGTQEKLDRELPLGLEVADQFGRQDLPHPLQFQQALFLERKKIGRLLHKTVVVELLDQLFAKTVALDHLDEMFELLQLRLSAPLPVRAVEKVIPHLRRFTAGRAPPPGPQPHPPPPP